MKDLIRYEPYYGTYIFSHLGKIYSIAELPEIEDSTCYLVNKNNSSPPYNGLTAPTRVQIQYTNRCNLGCPHCYVNSGVALPEEMKDEEIKSLLIKLRDFGVLQIEWSGGEVFTRKNFLETVSFAKELGFEQIVLTNGYTIGKNFEETGFLWELFDRIQISVDGFEEHFNEWVGRDSWLYVKSAIEKLDLSRKEHSVLKITTTLDKRNLTDLSFIAKWISGKNIVWKLGKQVSNGRSNINEEDSFEVLEQSYAEIQSLRSRFAINVVHPFDKSEYAIDTLMPVEWNTEVGARWFMYIKANGDVYPFPFWDGVPGFKAGNVMISSLKDIWYSQVFDWYRSVSRDRTTKCKDCTLICQMWSRPFNYFIHNDLFENPVKHPNCPIDA